MNKPPIKTALVGIGEIARNQHIPSIEKNPAFELTAAVSRHGTVDGIDNFKNIEDLIAGRPDIDLVSLCTPPQVRFDMAWAALRAGKHVMLEKPPGATLSEVETLNALASNKDLTLFATWHSRFAPAVEPARQWLADKKIEKVHIEWKEDVRKWHPGQSWIWQPGGMGIFDPGINALSIVTEIMPHAFYLTSAKLEFPENRQTPIAAQLLFTDHNQIDLSADLDWRQTGGECWNVTIDTDAGQLLLAEGGAALTIAGETRMKEPEKEYDGLYARCAELIHSGGSQVDVSPMRHVADAFTLGERITVAPFHD